MISAGISGTFVLPAIYFRAKRFILTVAPLCTPLWCSTSCPLSLPGGHATHGAKGCVNVPSLFLLHIHPKELMRRTNRTVGARSDVLPDLKESRVAHDGWTATCLPSLNYQRLGSCEWDVFT